MLCVCLGPQCLAKARVAPQGMCSQIVTTEWLQVLSLFIHLEPTDWYLFVSAAWQPFSHAETQFDAYRPSVHCHLHAVTTHTATGLRIPLPDLYVGLPTI